MTAKPRPPANATELGLLLCEITEEILWPSAHAGDRSLHCRVGSGQATYHRFDPHHNRHLITYGVRMIEAKQHPDTARGWLSLREILGRHYFDGEPSPLNLLAHTCCHEFAHLLQCQAGQRYRGSVHNHHFYTILDQLHLDGRAQLARQALAQGVRAQGLSLDERPLNLTAGEPCQHTWQAGQEVTFATRKGTVRGRILRVNRRSCTVDGIGHFRGVRYRVPLQLLEAAG